VRGIDALNAIHDPRLQKQVVGYNMEPAMTPREELPAVDKSIVAFGNYCHEHRLKLNWAPGGFRIRRR
jgi:hypothetical protein